jgi:hypothetical protein
MMEDGTGTSFDGWHIEPRQQMSDAAGDAKIPNSREMFDA